MSPSHTVGSEPVVVKPRKKISTLSPSHTVGSERRCFGRKSWKNSVTIPHGGLRTVLPRGLSGVLDLSPSHTVGSERITFFTKYSLSKCHHPTRWARNTFPYALKKNPNKQEQCHHPTRWAQNSERENSENWIFRVTIPHGGLRTQNSTEGFTLRELAKVTIPHGGLRTSNDNIKQNKTYQSFCQEGTPFKWS